MLKAVKLFKKSEFDFAELKSNAEVLWIQAIQLSYFPAECKYASRNANVKIPACEKTVTPVIKQLGLLWMKIAHCAVVQDYHNILVSSMTQSIQFTSQRNVISPS